MAVPKKRTSISKKIIQNTLWKKRNKYSDNLILRRRSK